jgi:hypothetical protein
MKSAIKDYPFSVIYQDKLSNKTGKPYSALSVSFTSILNKEAKDPKDKYKTEYLNFISPEYLLKLGTLCLNAYSQIRNMKAEERAETRGETAPQATAPMPDDLNDDVPFIFSRSQ